MGILEPLRAANRYLKAYRKAQMGRRLSAVRRIERVFPPPGQLVVAMTFDDGPTASPAHPGDGRGLTTALLDTMAAYGAHGTFDVIGTTADNYPDTEGRLGGALWSGRRYDHYPEFGRDELAGVVNELSRKPQQWPACASAATPAAYGAVGSTSVNGASAISSETEMTR
jgi:hypothetical protein